MHGQKRGSVKDLGSRFIQWSPPQQLSLQSPQCELMQHFSTSTSLAPWLLEGADVQQIWQQKVAHEAQAHDFLLQGIFGFVAFHRSCLHGPKDRDYHAAALRYHAKASKTFQAAVADVNGENCTAVFTFSLLMAMCQFHVSVTSSLLSPTDQFESLLSALVALRGSWYLLMHFRSLIKQGPFGTLLQRPRGFVQNILDPETSEVLQGLEVLNQSDVYTMKEKDICSEVIRSLAHWYSLVTPAPRTWAHIVQWPAIFWQEYFALLKRKQSMALVIFAHWCVPVHRAPYRWYANGWAKRAVYVIADLLGVDYTRALTWPLHQVGLDAEIDPTVSKRRVYYV